MLPNIMEYYKMMRDNNINIVYNGPIWAEGVEGIGETLRRRFVFDELPLSISQAVFSVFIEQMQNILNYSADGAVFSSQSNGKECRVASGIFILGVQDKQYFIQCANKMKDEQIDAIRERIDYLNTLNKPELRKYYKEQLKAENQNPESRGAGLGLIEIARRASSKLEYDFVPMEEGYSFFTLYVAVG